MVFDLNEYCCFYLNVILNFTLYLMGRKWRGEGSRRYYHRRREVGVFYSRFDCVTHPVMRQFKI